MVEYWAQYSRFRPYFTAAAWKYGDLWPNQPQIGRLFDESGHEAEGRMATIHENNLGDLWMIGHKILNFVKMRASKTSDDDNFIKLPPVTIFSAM